MGNWNLEVTFNETYNNARWFKESSGYLSNFRGFLCRFLRIGIFYFTFLGIFADFTRHFRRSRGFSVSHCSSYKTFKCVNTSTIESSSSISKSLRINSLLFRNCKRFPRFPCHDSCLLHREPPLAWPKFFSLLCMLFPYLLLVEIFHCTPMKKTKI